MGRHAIVPSYIQKVGRAKQHLVELESAIADFAAREPYEVRTTIQGKKKRKTRTLEFTASPANTEIPIIAADVIYNLRSALDHLMASLVAPNRRTHVMFPIFFQGVWESLPPRENAKRREARERWASFVKTLPQEPIAILKRLQPPDRGGKPDEVNLLEVVNQLSNRDRHTKLPVVNVGLSEMVVGWPRSDRIFQTSTPPIEAGGYVSDGATLREIPYSAVDVQVKGSLVVAIRIAEKGRDIAIPRHLNDAARFIESAVIAKLASYVRADA